MPVEGTEFRKVLGRFCSGIVIVTGEGGGEPVGMTAQSFASLSIDPPLVLFCAAKTSTTWPRIRASGTFCVNILSEGQEPASRSFAVPGAAGFRDVAWEWSDGGLPVLAGCLAYLSCSLIEMHDAGDHEIAVGLVRDLTAGHASDPLLYYQGNYRRLHSTGGEPGRKGKRSFRVGILEYPGSRHARRRTGRRRRRQR